MWVGPAQKIHFGANKTLLFISDVAATSPTQKMQLEAIFIVNVKADSDIHGRNLTFFLHSAKNIIHVRTIIFVLFLVDIDQVNREVLGTCITYH